MKLTTEERANLLVQQMYMTVLANVTEHFGGGGGLTKGGLYVPEQPLTREEVAKAIAVGIANAVPHMMMLISVAEMDEIKTSTLEAVAAYEAEKSVKV